MNITNHLILLWFNHVNNVWWRFQLRIPRWIISFHFLLLTTKYFRQRLFVLEHMLRTPHKTCLHCIWQNTSHSVAGTKLPTAFDCYGSLFKNNGGATVNSRCVYKELPNMLKFIMGNNRRLSEKWQQHAAGSTKHGTKARVHVHSGSHCHIHIVLSSTSLGKPYTGWVTVT